MRRRPEPGLTAEQRAEARKLFESSAQCPHCGGLHLRACPRVKRLAFNADGRVVEVEFWPPGSWPADDIVWPEDVQDED